MRYDVWYVICCDVSHVMCDVCDVWCAAATNYGERKGTCLIWLSHPYFVVPMLFILSGVSISFILCHLILSYLIFFSYYLVYVQYCRLEMWMRAMWMRAMWMRCGCDVDAMWMRCGCDVDACDVDAMWMWCGCDVDAAAHARTAGHATESHRAVEGPYLHDTYEGWFQICIELFGIAFLMCVYDFCKLCNNTNVSGSGRQEGGRVFCVAAICLWYILDCSSRRQGVGTDAHTPTIHGSAGFRDSKCEGQS